MVRWRRSTTTTTITTLVLLLLLIVVDGTTTTSQRSCRSKSDCGEREICYTSTKTCGCLTSLGLQGPPQCAETTSATYFIIIFDLCLNIGHIGALYLEILGLGSHVRETRGRGPCSLWWSLTSYKSGFLLTSILFNLHPLINRTLETLIAFSSTTPINLLSHYNRSLRYHILYIGYVSFTFSLIIIARILVTLAAQLGDQKLIGLSRSRRARWLLLLPAIVMLVLLIIPLVKESPIWGSAGLFTTSFIISLFYGYATVASLGALKRHMIARGELPPPPLPISLSSTTTTGTGRRRHTQSILWDAGLDRYRVLSTIIENSEAYVSCESLERASVNNMLLSSGGGSGPRAATTIIPTTIDDPLDHDNLPTVPTLPLPQTITTTTSSSTTTSARPVPPPLPSTTERAMTTAHNIVLLALRVTICTLFTSLTLFTYAIIPQPTSAWGGTIRFLLVNLGTTSLLVANIHCLCLISRPAKNILDSLLPERSASSATGSGGGGGGGFLSPRGSIETSLLKKVITATGTTTTST